jgi:hypothetical protein
MTTEHLLKPRWKIIAAIPFKEEEDFWKVGEILDRDWGWHGDDEDGFKYHISDYPHLFKKLEWYEERKPEEMPEYVRWNYNPKTDNEDVRGLVEKVIKWVQNGYGVVTSGNMVIATRHWLPATLAEYEQYINQKEKQ